MGKNKFTIVAVIAAGILLYLLFSKPSSVAAAAGPKPLTPNQGGQTPPVIGGISGILSAFAALFSKPNNPLGGITIDPLHIGSLPLTLPPSFASSTSGDGSIDATATLTYVADGGADPNADW